MGILNKDTSHHSILDEGSNLLVSLIPVCELIVMDITGKLLGGKFKLKHLLAQGGSADVYVAQPLGETDFFAIKVLPAVDGVDRLVKREVAMLKKLNHPNIVRFVEDGFDPDVEDGERGAYFIVLELIEGIPIDKYFLQELPLHKRMQLFLQLLDAIAYAHGRSVIHRDIKPSNVYVVEDALEPQVKVLDFGIAAVTDTISPQRTVRGYFSDLFASPEQVQWEGFTHTTDVFSVCVLFLYLLVGKDIQDQARQQRKRELIVDAARRTLGESESGVQLIKCLEEGIAQESEKRPPLDRLRLAISKLRDQTIELRQLVIYLTPKFAESIDLGEGYPGAAKVYVRNALRQGDGLVHLKLLPDKDNEQQQKQKGLDLGNDAAGVVFRGFFDSKGGYIVLHSELRKPETELHYLNEDGVPCKIEPLVFDEAYEARNATSERSLDDLYEAMEVASLKSQRARADHKDRKNNQTFGIWSKIIDLKQLILDEEKSPLRYRNYRYEPANNTLTLTLTDTESISTADIVTQFIAEETPLTISVGNNRRKKRTRQVSCGHAIRSVQKDSTVSEVTLQLPVELRFNIEEIADKGTIEIDKQAQQMQISREKYALEDARTSSSENPRLFEILASPADAPCIEPRRSHRFFDQDLERDENQREAVERALGTQDLFLIQGPPGTGKTTVITELVLQILDREPHARILISSQSNIAVDNVLVKLGKARAEGNLPEPLRERLRIVRIGREESIDMPAQIYRVEQAVLEWQREALDRSSHHWKEYSAQKGDLLDGAEKLEQLGKLDNHIDLRDTLSQRLVKAATKAAAAYTPALHSTFEQQAFEVDEIVWEKVQAEEELRAALDAYTEQYEVRSPEQDKSAREWLAAETARVEELLGKDSKHLKQFEALQMLQREWTEKLQHSQSDLEALYLENVRILGATCSKVGAYKLKDLSFDWVIIDEAGRATPAETLVAAVKGKRIVLVGDHKQLPPVVDHKFAKQAESELELARQELEESLFEHLYRALPEANKITLRQQYRMHPGIGELVGKLFYKEEGLSSERVSFDKKMHGLLTFSCPIYWVSTGTPRKQIFHKKAGKSFHNPYEANVIAHLLCRIQKDCTEGSLLKDVGVITAYAAQKSTLELAIEPGNLERWPNLSITVHTVDAFQGKDCDIVVFDLVRSHKDGKLGFTSDYRRLNVALSRAKQLLFIVGSDYMAYRGKTADGGPNPFRPLIDYIQQQKDTCKVIPSQEITDEANHG